VIGDRLAAEIVAVYPGDAVLGAPGAPPEGRMLARYSWVVGPVDCGHPWQLCYAATGALDLLHDHRTSLREVAGAAAVVLEAGGVITLADGGSLFPPPAQVAGAPLAVLAGNPTSHGQALADVVGASSNVYGHVIVS
jgi:fructose-1,6-bisphosphatase/inositol monophosphatase family enzyme